MRKGCAAGFTLVEMMVALVIGSVIILGAGQLVLSLFTTFERVETLSRQQEALIFATQALTRDIRHGQAHRYDISDSLADDATCALRRDAQPLIEGLHKGHRGCSAIELWDKSNQGVPGLYRVTLEFDDRRRFSWHVMQRDQVVSRTLPEVGR
ncbi:prepilin-type N-terminal cleavage/methylation domain-containing protein [Halomonas aquamarina]|uniref:Prepilin-type N-terminal cleavage/methylation domain-containing protein n=1 Tax=Vreelandella aquamarina TaxID=77097 RepID=A0ACC5VX19_9GAMM|nr:prepilin-type N-terminal cleavage/methylation domain-containing protein [Halomonas aquamarina]MBZ5488707.1 prepilin-type N-terminal cleavage/methylation domain-containing protein [Halomonas aquamarina]